MRIAVDALSQVTGGGLTVVQHLVPEIARLRPDWRLTVFSATSPFGVDAPPNVEPVAQPVLRSLWKRFVWQQRRLPGVLRSGGYEVLLNLGGYAMARSPVPQICVWQNSNLFSSARIPRPAWLRAYIAAQRVAQGWSLPRASRNVFLTQTSLEDAAAIWPIERYSASVIPLGFDAPPELGETRERESFALAVGHVYTHKNYEALIDAIAICAEMDHPIHLRIAGPADRGYQGALQRRAERCGAAAWIQFLGPLDRARIFDLYRRARVYVTTSLLESFGMTVLEAMACGAPVAASNASCIPEVAGDAAIYFDPRDPREIAATLVRLMDDDALCAELRQRGHRRVPEFSWERTAREYARLLEGARAQTP